MRPDLSGQAVKIVDGFNDPFNGHIPPGSEFRVEGYWDDLTGKSWMVSDGNPAAMNYAMRILPAGIPMDNDVLYGKIGPLGFLVHLTEVE